MLRAAVVTLLAATALVVSGCGGDGGGGEGTAPEEYAAAVCGALTAWQNELQTSATTMGSTVGAATSPTEARTKLVEFMDAMTKSTQTMVSKVEGAGAPAVDDGEALHRDLVAGLQDAQEAFAAARDRAEALPTDDPTAFQQQAGEISATLNREGSAIGSAFTGLSTKYDSQELNEAFNSEPACQSLS